MAMNLDMFQMLKEDHARLKSDIQQVLSMISQEQQNREEVKRRLQSIHRQWELHNRLEIEHLYPVMAKVDDTRELIEEFYEAHRNISKMESNLLSQELPVDRLRDELRRMLDVIDRHIRDEEGELFPAVRENLKPDEIDNMSRQMRQMKEVEMSKQPF